MEWMGDKSSPMGGKGKDVACTNGRKGIYNKADRYGRIGGRVRYCFSLFKGYVWKDLVFNPTYFWGMWGIKRTLKFIVEDTIKECLRTILEFVWKVTDKF